MPKFTERLQHAWNAFVSRDPPKYGGMSLGYSTSQRPDRTRLSRGNERSIINTVLTRISVDCAAVDIQHVDLDKNGRYLSIRKSGLNNCLQLEANIDQTGRAFIQDVVMSMLDEGCVALVPVVTDISPEDSSSFDIIEMRVGKVTAWYPKHVRVDLYNDNTGLHEELLFRKDKIGIVENPFYSIMNEPNSTLQRLTRKLSIMDVVDEESGSGRLNMIIQLPYAIKSEARRQQAEERAKDIEVQLSSSKYGIAYTDSSEKIIQLNRSLENNLLSQIEFLTNQLYSQLGITLEILNGSADEKTMLNYNNRIIEPIISALVLEMRRRFLTKTARTQNQSIVFFKDPFKLVPVSQIAEIADKFTRNEIMSSNEIRQIVGLKPIADSKADELRNKNLNVSTDQEFASTNEDANAEETSEETNGNTGSDSSEPQRDFSSMEEYIAYKNSHNTEE